MVINIYSDSFPFPVRCYRPNHAWISICLYILIPNEISEGGVDMPAGLPHALIRYWLGKILLRVDSDTFLTVLCSRLLLGNSYRSVFLCCTVDVAYGVQGFL